MNTRALRKGSRNVEKGVLPPAILPTFPFLLFNPG